MHYKINGIRPENIISSDTLHKSKNLRIEYLFIEHDPDIYIRISHKVSKNLMNIYYLHFFSNCDAIPYINLIYDLCQNH